MTVSSGALLSDALVHSPIVAGEDGSGAPPASMAGYEFGVDPNIDPELQYTSHIVLNTTSLQQEGDRLYLDKPGGSEYRGVLQLRTLEVSAR